MTREGAGVAPIAGVPAVYSLGQGGLLDIALAPDFATSRLIYFSFGEPGRGRRIDRGRTRASHR